MKKNTMYFLYAIIGLVLTSPFCICNASGGYTKSVSIGGTNDVEYTYIEHETSKNENDDDECDKCEKEYIYIKRPYQYSRWETVPYYGYNYNQYNPYGRGPTIYTYTPTGFKTGPDGRTLTPLQQRDLYDRMYSRPHHHPRNHPPHRKNNYHF